jgi:acetyl-CoA C-acetyltransferase
MGQTAENLAHRFGITRAQMDAFSVRSHQRVTRAQEEGHLAPGGGEVEALYASDGKAYLLDDGVRRDASVENLARLKPFFDRKYGNVTPGNSSQITDGAAWLLLASEEAVKKHDLQPVGRILDSQWAGLDPAQMGLGPVHAATPILKRHGLKLDGVDYWEINEAFAAQVLGCLEAWKDERYCREQLELDGALGALDEDRLNVDGGAVALGHPVGASGARIVLHLIRQLKRKNAKRGMASICIGGGLGGAMLVEAL